MFNRKMVWKTIIFPVSPLLLGSFMSFKRRNLIFQQTSKDFPIYTRRDVMNHCSKEERIWVTYRDGVYDVTEWMDVHPGGGDKIMMVAGGSLDAFWEMYAFHKKPEIFEVLEKYRVGNLAKQDIIDPKSLPNYDKLKSETIQRSHELLTLQSFPFCAECPGPKLIENFYTPEEYFFVRNHNSTPLNLKKSDYKLSIRNSLKDTEKSIIFDDLLKKYPKKTVETIIMCTGNRRSHMNKPDKPKGLSWNAGAIANGKWEGILLREILKDFGLTKENSKGLHLIVNGYDKDFQGSNYSISVPMELLFREDTDAILAFSYNGQDIPYEHGFPLRLIIPGIVGVRNVKWIKSIEIADHESMGPFQQRDYKIVHTPDIDKVDLSKYPAIMEQKINSAILYPLDGTEIKSNKLNKIHGWAIGHFGAKIKSIKISFDQGQSWHEVRNLKYNENEIGKVFGWTLWNYDLPSDLKGDQEIWVKAEDCEGNSQPKNCEEIWNFRGLMTNSIHKIKITIT